MSLRDCCVFAAGGGGKAEAEAEAGDDSGDSSDEPDSESEDDESDDSDDDTAAPPNAAAASVEVGRLKAQYKKLKGAAARGSQANDPGWLKQRIAEMEKGQFVVSKPARKKTNMPSGAGGSEKKAGGGGAAPKAVSAKVASGEVAKLKAQYKKLKGAAARGSQANNPDWLKEKIAELSSAGAGAGAAGDDGEDSDGDVSDGTHPLLLAWFCLSRSLLSLTVYGSARAVLCCCATCLPLARRLGLAAVIYMQ